MRERADSSVSFSTTATASSAICSGHFNIAREAPQQIKGCHSLELTRILLPALRRPMPLLFGLQTFCVFKTLLFFLQRLRRLFQLFSAQFVAPFEPYFMGCFELLLGFLMRFPFTLLFGPVLR